MYLAKVITAVDQYTTILLLDYKLKRYMYVWLPINSSRASLVHISVMLSPNRKKFMPKACHQKHYSYPNDCMEGVQIKATTLLL